MDVVCVAVGDQHGGVFMAYPVYVFFRGDRYVSFKTDTIWFLR